MAELLTIEMTCIIHGVSISITKSNAAPIFYRSAVIYVFKCGAIIERIFALKFHLVTTALKRPCVLPIIPQKIIFTLKNFYCRCAIDYGKIYYKKTAECSTVFFCVQPF